MIENALLGNDVLEVRVAPSRAMTTLPKISFVASLALIHPVRRNVSVIDSLEKHAMCRCQRFLVRQLMPDISISGGC